MKLSRENLGMINEGPGKFFGMEKGEGPFLEIPKSSSKGNAKTRMAISSSGSGEYEYFPQRISSHGYGDSFCFTLACVPQHRGNVPQLKEKLDHIPAGMSLADYEYGQLTVWSYFFVLACSVHLWSLFSKNNGKPASTIPELLPLPAPPDGIRSP